jgi:hypothetical protein
MITILVGNAHADVKEDINFGTTWGEMLPSELVVAFEEYLEDCTAPITIRVYTDTIVNWIGLEIEKCEIRPHEVYIYTPDGGRHYFDVGGVISSKWPYGIFNY